MAYQTSQTRMVIAYANKVTQDYVSTVTANFTPDVGFPATNLAYDDPAMKLKHSTHNGTTNRLIEVTFAVSQTFTCGGIANHNLVSQGYETIDIAYWNGSSFVSCGGGSQDISAYTDDPNFILRWPAQSSTRWQITLGKASGNRPAFYLGLVFLGTLYECETGPNDGGAFYTEEWQSDRLVAMGGTAYERPVAMREEETGELSWDRISSTMALTLRNIRKTNRGKVVAVIFPHDVTAVMPSATQHFFGRIVSRTTSPRFGGKHQATITLRGLQ